MTKPSHYSGKASKSKDVISKSVDKAMDNANPASINAAPGISIRNGPIEEMEVDEAPNGTSKRKGRGSMVNGKSYKEASESEDDDKPLVSQR